MTSTLKTNTVKRQVILADGTILRNEQIPIDAGAARKDEKTGEIMWIPGWKRSVMSWPERMSWSQVKSFKIGKHTHHVLNGWTIGWCYVVADSPVSRAAARSANRAIGMGAFSDLAGCKAWPYDVDGVRCDVMTQHAPTFQMAAERGKLMADALLKHGITSRVYVMTDKQYGLGCSDGIKGLTGLRLQMVDKHHQNRTTWVLTAKQSVPLYQTSL